MSSRLLETGHDRQKGTGNEILLWTATGTRINIAVVIARELWKFELASLVAACKICTIAEIDSANMQLVRHIWRISEVRLMCTSYEPVAVIEPNVVAVIETTVFAVVGTSPRD